MTRSQEILQKIEEISLHRVVSFRGGHRRTIKTCQPGYRKEGTRCIRQSSGERMRRHRGHVRAMRKNAVHAGRIERRRARSLLRRAGQGY